MKEANFTITLTDNAIDIFKDNLLSYLEIEILQGVQTRLPDGRTEFKLTVGDDKLPLVKQYMIELMKYKQVNSDN